MFAPADLAPILFLPDLSAHQCPGNGLVETFRKAREHWAFLNCSMENEHQLRQYFTAQFNSLASELERACNTECLGSIMASLEKLYGHYIDPGCICPDTLVTMLQGQSTSSRYEVDKIIHVLAPAELQECLFAYLNFPDGSNVTYAQWRYYSRFLRTVSAVKTQKELINVLVKINFNHLCFFLFMIGEQQKRLKKLSAHAGLAMIQTEMVLLELNCDGPSFDRNWPPVWQMVRNWLAEEKMRLSTSLSSPCAKIPLNLSVAQLACFLRVFFEENIFGPANLTDLFKFIAGHYTTKRQPLISPGSLSKEFYSVSQVNAAVTRDYLQKMLARINKHYFPVWVALGVWLYGF